jgi:predicted GH43/DUF377 family glycosyl hydrolase
VTSEKKSGTGDGQALRKLVSDFHGNGFFQWQFSDQTHRQRWEDWHYDEERYWGGFARDPIDLRTYSLPDWAIGPFAKHSGNPVFSPDPTGWDCGHFGGGVHNGSILERGGRLFYVYRGEFPMPDEARFAAHRKGGFNYLCDIGVAASDDGVRFRRIAGPVLRRPEDWRFSFEDVSCVQHEGRYYMFLNRWDWERMEDPSTCGTYLAVSDDLLRWEHKGLVFPKARRIHRNAVVLQDPQNRPVRDAQGRFVMYINNGLIAHSRDLVHWESTDLTSVWPGGECAIAVAQYHPANRDHVVLFTGGNHTGHFYALGEVLFSRRDPGTPIEWLPRPVLSADTKIPYEDGFSADPPHQPVSYWRDTVFACGMTAFRGQWFLYYGGSEYYTCLATAHQE